MAGLNTGGPRFAGDDGAADPRVAAVLAAYGAGRDSEQAALTALAGARLLVPLVERPAGDHDDEHPHGDDGCDHQAARELAFPTLIGRDGRPALLAFTSLAALVAWRPEARPVPTPAEQVWGTAVADTGAVVIDVAGPVPVAVDGARLAALAAGAPPPAPQDDPDTRAEVAAALAELPAGAGAVVTGAELAPGPDGTDLAVTLLVRLTGPAPGQTGAQQAAGPEVAVQQAVQRAAEAIAARQAGRLRRGIQFSAAFAPAAPAATPAPAPSRARG